METEKTPAGPMRIARVREGAFPGEKPSPANTRHGLRPPQALPGAFFSSVSEEKKQKKTAFVHKLACKKSPPQTGSPFSEQNNLPYIRFSGGSGRGLFPGKSLLPPYRHNSPPQQALPGAFFSSVAEEKKQKKTAFSSKLAHKKKPPQTGSPFLYKKPFPICAFREGPGGGFSRGKAFSRQYRHCTSPQQPCRGPSFLLCQKKRSKRRPHMHPSWHTKRNHRKPAVPSCTNHPSPYALFGRVREGAFPGEKPSPALPPPIKNPVRPRCGLHGDLCMLFTLRTRCCGFPGSRLHGSGRGTPFPARCAWPLPWPAPWCPRR